MNPQTQCELSCGSLAAAIGPAYRKRSILVTGANGVLGTALSIRAAELGANVVALTRRPDVLRRKLAALGYMGRDIETFSVCLSDTARVHEAISLFRPWVVFHLASQAIVSECERRPTGAWEDNCTASFNLARTLRDLGVGACIALTSDKAYGSSPHIPYIEEQPLIGGRTGSVYELTKVIQEHVFGWLNAYIPTLVLRSANIVGLDDHLSRVIPATIARLLRGGAPRLYRHSADHVRTYVDARDAADACLLAGSAAERDGIRGEAFNVGNPANVFATRDVIAKVMESMNAEQTVEVVDSPQTLPQNCEITKQTLDITKIRNRLGWYPRYSFEQTLQWTIAAYSKVQTAERAVRNRPLRRSPRPGRGLEEPGSDEGFVAGRAVVHS
jgi:nucleoside-diphosphate-sugar epimerase